MRFSAVIFIILATIVLNGCSGRRLAYHQYNDIQESMRLWSDAMPDYTPVGNAAKKTHCTTVQVGYAYQTICQQK